MTSNVNEDKGLGAAERKVDPSIVRMTSSVDRVHLLKGISCLVMYAVCAVLILRSCMGENGDWDGTNTPLVVEIFWYSILALIASHAIVITYIDLYIRYIDSVELNDEGLRFIPARVSRLLITATDDGVSFSRESVSGVVSDYGCSESSCILVTLRSYWPIFILPCDDEISGGCWGGVSTSWRKRMLLRCLAVPAVRPLLCVVSGWLLLTSFITLWRIW